MSAYTLADFVAELETVDNLGPRLRDESLEGYPGLVWRNQLYIEKAEDGEYVLTLMNSSWKGPELEPAATRLFAFARAEGYLNGEPEVERPQTFEPAPLTAEQAIAAIRETLWPGGDEDAWWEPDTLDDIAEIIRRVP